MGAGRGVRVEAGEWTFRQADRQKLNHEGREGQKERERGRLNVPVLSI